MKISLGLFDTSYCLQNHNEAVRLTYHSIPDVESNIEKDGWLWKYSPYISLSCQKFSLYELWMQNLGAIRFTKGGEHDQVPRIGLHPGTVVHMLRTLLHGRIWVLVNPHPRRCHMQDVSIMPVYHSSSVPWPHPRVPWSTPTPRVPLIAMNGPLAPCQGSIVVSQAVRQSLVGWLAPALDNNTINILFLPPLSLHAMPVRVSTPLGPG